MHNIKIDDSARITIQRSGGQLAAMLQVKETNGWETNTTKVYDANTKGTTIIKEMNDKYQEHLRKTEYDKGLMEPYH